MAEYNLPEVLGVRESGDANHYVLIDESTGDWLVGILMDGRPLPDKQRAILRRIAACWNHLSGFTTEEIELLTAKMKEQQP